MLVITIRKIKPSKYEGPFLVIYMLLNPQPTCEVAYYPILPKERRRQAQAHKLPRDQSEIGSMSLAPDLAL
jgi:hypothetical protein